MDLRVQCFRINASGFSWNIDHARCSWNVTSLMWGCVHAIRESFSYRHEKLSCRVWTRVHHAAQNHIRCQWRSTFKIGAAQLPSVTDSARERKYYLIYTVVWTLGSLNKDIFERRMSTGSIFPFNMPWLYQICISKCLLSYRDDLSENLVVKITPQVAKRSLPVNVRRSKTSLLNRAIYTRKNKTRLT